MANSSVVGLLKVLLTAETAQFEKALAGADSHVTKLANTMKRDLEPSQKRINMLVRDFLGSKEIGLANDYAEAVSRAGGAAKLTAADQAKVNRAVTDALAHYKALGQQAPASLIALANATKQVQIPTEKLGGGLESLIGRAKMLAGVFGVTLSAGALVSVAKRAFDAADAIGDLSVKMGVSTDAAQRFQYAARQSGADIEDVSRAIVQMNNQLAEGGKSTVSALTAVGLKFHDIRAMKPEDAFRAIADAIGEIPDPMRQTQVAMELFGKAGADILVMIRDGSLKLADGVAIWSKAEVQALKEAQQEWENLGNSVVLVSGKIIATLTDLKSVLRLLAFGGSANFFMVDAIREAEAVGNARLAELAKLRASLTSPGAMSSHGPKAPKILTKDEQDALDKFNKEVTSLVSELSGNKNQHLEKLAAAVKQIGDVSKIAKPDLEKIREELDKLFLAGVELPLILDKLRLGPNRFLDFTKPPEKEWQKFFAWVDEQHARLRPKDLVWTDRPLIKVPDYGPPIDSRIIFGPQNAMVAQLETFWFQQNKLLEEQMKSWRQKIAKTIGSGLLDAVGQLPDTVMAALTGGGNVGKAVGGLFGGAATKGIGAIVGKSLSGMLGKTLGGAIGSIIPGLGTLLGSGIGALFGKLFGKEGARVNDTRDEFMAANGGLIAMQKTIAKFSNDPQLSAAFNRLYFTGKEGDFKSGMDAYQKRLGELQANQLALAENMERLTASLQVFGGVVPKSLNPLLQQLLGSANLTAEMRAQFEELAGAPTWQVLQSRAETLGIALSALGSNFSQARISDMALQYVRDLNLFADAGADANGVLAGMADELSMVVQEAVKSGAALPKTLEPFLKRLSEMGLLLDENGQRIDMGALSFKDIEDEALKQVVNVLEQIRDLLLGIPLAAQRAAQGLTGWSVPKTGHDEPGFDMGLDSAQLPSFAGGTHGAYMDFGPGTPVMLHGQERVSTRGEGSGGTFNIYAIDAPSFETFLKQRGGAEAVVRSLPTVVERWGGAR